MHASVAYNLAFAAAVCVVCAIVVSSAAVALQDRQAANAALDRDHDALVHLAADDDALDFCLSPHPLLLSCRPPASRRRARMLAAAS